MLQRIKTSKTKIGEKINETWKDKNERKVNQQR